MFRAVLFLLACFELFAFISGPCQANAAEKENQTPLLLSVADAPAPFTGSDGCIHLAYQLWITNFSSGDASIENVEVLGDGSVLHKMDAAEISRRLQPAGIRPPQSVFQWSATRRASDRFSGRPLSIGLRHPSQRLHDPDSLLVSARQACSRSALWKCHTHQNRN